MKVRRAVFLDRDGTLSRDVGYPADWSQVHIYPFSFEAVRRIRRAGLAPVVITNQSGVGRGFFSEDELGELHKRFLAAFEDQGAPFDGIYHCPHYSQAAGEGREADCACAKPNPALAVRAAAELGLELSGSYMVGDKPCDILLGLAIGAVPVLVLTGYGRLSLADLRSRGVHPAYVADDLAAAAAWIAGREERAAGPARTGRRRNGARS
ncbi:MAG TPA: HAD family hydrolase [Burkholderiales bacterium]|nr:HAD family hydrolase [Burkholderiales bacterium]